MSATITLAFGSLSLDDTNNITVSDISEKSKKPIRPVSIPKTDGVIIETVKIGAKTITLKGDIAGTSYDDLRTNIDALRAGFLNGKQKLTKDDERYIYCQMKSFSFKYDHLTTRATWTAQFVAHYPFWLAETPTTDTRSPTTGVSYEITNSGNAPTRIKFEITPTAEMADDCKVENTTTGETFQYRGTVDADNKLEIDNRYDTDDFEIENNGADDHTNFEGDFMTLNSGANTIKFTGAGTPSIILTHKDAWY